MLEFISDTDHFTKVLDLASKAKQTLWIGTKQGDRFLFQIKWNT